MQEIDFGKFKKNERFDSLQFVSWVAMNAIKSYFENKIPEDEKNKLSWYIKNKKLFINTSNPFVKIELFKYKKVLLEQINQKFKKTGYNTRLNDIFIKAKSFIENDDEFL